MGEWADEVKEYDSQTVRSGSWYALSDTICEQNAQEIVFGMPDKHLTFHASLWCGEKEPGGQTFTITTVVKFNNRLGRLYFFFIRPFHKVIIRSMLKRVAKRLKKTAYGYK